MGLSTGWFQTFGFLTNKYPVGGLEHEFYFPFHIYIYGILLPIDELIFFRGVETTNQKDIDHRYKVVPP